ncbi:hypothetical protein [Aestuariibius sp. HNIBRBA575]|uniref:hypothetical protein n=1 Tax=Aestuariibius sp. HNIBRBA575 TaxID=3233343 RepID=UPI0034A41500
MNKLIAIICVVSWSGFWAFGYIALTTQVHDSIQLTIAALLAFAGLITGISAYFRLAQFAEENGMSHRAGGAIVFHKNNGQEIG